MDATVVTGLDGRLGSELKSAVKRGAFDTLVLSTLDSAVAQLPTLDWARLAVTNTPAEFATLKQLCYLVEVLDYFGKWDLAGAVAFGGEQVLEYLKTGDWQADRLTREALREKARFAGAWTRVAVNRGGRDYKLAAKRLQLLVDIVTNRIRQPADGFPCLRTIAQLRYYRGRALRHLRLSDLAEQEYRKAIDHYADFVVSARAVEPTRNLDHSEAAQAERKRLEDVSEARYKIAICQGLGLGKLASMRGELEVARTHVSSARAMIPKADLINSAALDELYGSILLRAEQGPVSSESIADARAMINGARQVFSHNGHRGYAAHATYELAYAEYLAKNYTEAHALLDNQLQLEKEAGQTSLGRAWVLNACNLRARIFCGEGRLPEALATARKALSDAAAYKDRPYLMTGPLIALSEVYMAMPAWRDASEALRRALRRCGTQANGVDRRSRNAQLEATCLFYLARCQLRQGKVGQARSMYSRACDRARHVENGWVRQLQQAITNEINETEAAFQIPANAVSLDSKIWTGELMAWLFERARRRVADKETRKTELVKLIAKEMNAGRNTVTALYDADGRR